MTRTPVTFVLATLDAALIDAQSRNANSPVSHSGPEHVHSPRPEPAIGVNGAYYLLSSLSSLLDGEINIESNETRSTRPSFAYTSTLAILQHWDIASPFLEAITDSIIAITTKTTIKTTTATKSASPSSLQSIPFSTAPLLAPILYPNKLLAVGANYASHLREMNLPVEKWTPMPFFSRPPTTCLVGPSTPSAASIIIPPSTTQFDWECELAVILGAKLSRGSTIEDARKAIAGYSIGLDLTCRDLIVAGRGLGTDLVRGKAQDTMAPCGPHIVPARYFQQGAEGKRITLRVNGELMMDASTSEMVYKCDEILCEISQFVTLEPGDIVFTGSPAGSAGAHGGRWLTDEDAIQAEIEGVGVLEVGVRAAQR